MGIFSLIIYEVSDGQESLSDGNPQEKIPTEQQLGIQSWVITILHKKCASKINTQARSCPAVYPRLTAGHPEDQVPTGITIPD